ncbi:DUF3489 domain-containing protein, partial [Roseovarius salis]|uniref:DUF3489 domain-containing protein n=1 Tax=Roseovarius salis TaxID=3376063 RepID=UPI0037CB9878
ELVEQHGPLLDQHVAAVDQRPELGLGGRSQPCRGAFAGALKKKLGLIITSEKVDGRGRCYRIEDAS